MADRGGVLRGLVGFGSGRQRRRDLGDPMGAEPLRHAVRGRSREGPLQAGRHRHHRHHRLGRRRHHRAQHPGEPHGLWGGRVRGRGRRGATGHGPRRRQCRDADGRGIDPRHHAQLRHQESGGSGRKEGRDHLAEILIGAHLHHGAQSEGDSRLEGDADRGRRLSRGAHHARAGRGVRRRAHRAALDHSCVPLSHGGRGARSPAADDHVARDHHQSLRQGAS